MKKFWILLGDALKEIPAPLRIVLLLLIIYACASSGLLIKVVAGYEAEQRVKMDNEDVIIGNKEFQISRLERENDSLKQKNDSLNGRIFEVQTEGKNQQILLLEKVIHATKKK